MRVVVAIATEIRNGKRVVVAIATESGMGERDVVAIATEIRNAERVVVAIATEIRNVILPHVAKGCRQLENSIIGSLVLRFNMLCMWHALCGMCEFSN